MDYFWVTENNFTDEITLESNLKVMLSENCSKHPGLSQARKHLEPFIGHSSSLISSDQ